MRTIKIVGLTSIGSIIICCIVFFFFYANSYSRAIRRAGLHPDNITLLASGFDNNDNEYRVIVSTNVDSDTRFVYLVRGRGRMGTWAVEHMVADTPYAGITAYSWTITTGIRRFDVFDSVMFEWELHNVYFGNNAIRRIETISSYLPNNIAVNIHQAGSMFILHFIAFGENAFDTMNELRITDFLLSNEYIVPVDNF